MWLIQGPFLLLEIADLLLLVGRSGASSSHSLRYFYSGESEPSQGLPWFIQVGYMDDQLITRYDNNSRRNELLVTWLMQEEDPQYWERETQYARSAEGFFLRALVTLQNRYNQSRGLHTWQCMVGCELGKDGYKGGHMQYAYDGKDFISLNKETLTWIAAVVPAQVTKRKWEAEPAIAQQWRSYLETECLELLQKLQNRNKTLPTPESPVVKVTLKAGYDSLETLTCRAHGFYPKEIDIDWMKDGEVWLQDTFRGITSPNSDGTYYTWISVEVDSKDRDRYRCHVEHDGLQEPLDLAWEESASVALRGNVVAILVFTTAVLVIVIFFYIKGDWGESPSKSMKIGQKSSRGLRNWQLVNLDGTPTGS